MQTIKHKNGFPQIGGLLYESMRNKDYQTDPKTFAPSSLLSCERQIYYKKRLEKPSDPIQEPSLFKMAMGTKIHDYIQGLLKDNGIYKEGEDLKEVNWGGLDWKYALDGILEVDNEKYVLEIKTVYGEGFRFIEQEPKEDHLMQLIFYMQVEKINNGVLLYVGRDNGRILQFDIKGNGEFTINGTPRPDIMYRFDEIMDKFRALRGQIDQGVLPERPFKLYLKRYNGKINTSFWKDKVQYKTPWQCSYCQYKTKCHKYALDKFDKGNYNFLIDNKLIKTGLGQDEVLDLND